MIKKSFQPKGGINRTTMNKLYFPDKKISENIIKELMLYIEEGDVSKLRNQFINDKTLAGLRSEKGESLLNITIQSENLSEYQKYEICKVLIDFGAPLELVDENNVSPLHIACKMQLEKIVDLLISKNVNVNVFDSQKMSPLHYCIMNNLVKCKPMIQKKPYINNINNNPIELIEYSNKIVNKLYETGSITKYLYHIKKTLKNIHYMFPEEIEKIQKDFEKTVLTSYLTSGKANEEKLFTNLVISKEKIAQVITSKLKTVLGRMDISTEHLKNIEPPNYISVLPYRNVNDMINKIDTEMSINFDKIDSSKNNTDIVSSIAYLSIECKQATEQLMKINSVKPQERKIIDGMLKSYIDIGDINNKTVGFDIYANLKPKQYKMHIINSMDNELKHVSTSTVVPHKYFTNLIRYYSEILTEKSKKFTRLMNDIVVMLPKDNIYYVYYFVMTDVYICLFDMLICICIIDSELFYAKGKNNKLKNWNNEAHKLQMIEDITDKVNKCFINIQKECNKLYSFINDHINILNSYIDYLNAKSALIFIKAYFNGFDKDDTNELNNVFDKPFAKFVLIPKNFSEFIDKIGRINHNTGTKFDANKKIIFEVYIPQFTYKNIQTYLFKESDKSNKMYPLRPYNQTTKKFGDENKQVISLPYHESKIELPRIGFALYPRINNSGYNLSSGSVYYMFEKDGTKITPILKYGLEKTNYYDEREIKQANKANDHSLIGYCGFKKATTMKKNIKALESIGILLDEHLNMIKYEIIQKILKDLDEGKDGDDLVDSRNEFIKTIIIEKWSSTVNESKQLITYYITANIIDKLVSNYIHYCIQHASLFHILKIQKEIIIRSSSEKIKNLIIESPGRDYQLFLNNISQEFNQYNETIPDYAMILATDYKLDNDDQYSIYNDSFGQIKEKLCSNINPNIIEKLISAGCRINSKNVFGYTPLIYAIMTNNDKIIKELIKHGASVSNNFALSFSNQSPLDFALKQYKSACNKLSNYLSVTNEYYKNVIKKIIIKSEYQNNILRFSDNIFPQLLLMINHYLYAKSQQYLDGWTFEKHQEMISILEPIEKGFPLLKYLQPENNLGGKNYYINRKNHILNAIRINNDRISGLQNRIINMQKEIYAISSLMSDKYYSDRKTELEKIITDLSADIKKYETNIENYNNQLKKISKLESEAESKILDKLKNPFTISNLDIVEMYENYFSSVMNDKKFDSQMDTISYSTLWNKYIYDKEANISQIHILLTKYIESKLDLYSDKKINKVELVKNLQILQNFYKSICEPFIMDVEETPIELETNPELNYLIKILSHIIEHTIGIMLYNIIKKVIFKYIFEINSMMKIDESNDNVNEILSVKNNFILNYILKELPINAIKYFLKIYDNENDPIKLIIKPEELFTPINNNLNLNIIFPIDKQSVIIAILNKYIYPYFIDFFKIFIEDSMKFMNSYLNYIMSCSRQTSVLIMLLEKSLKELN